MDNANIITVYEGAMTGFNKYSCNATVKSSNIQAVYNGSHTNDSHSRLSMHSQSGDLA